MSNINKFLCLKLNKSWQVIGTSSIKKAIIDLASGLSAYALDMDYEKNELGEYILDECGNPVDNPISMIPVSWETWITLPVRSWEMDNAVRYGRGIMRAPTLIIAKNFNRMPMKTFRGKPSKEAIWLRDGGKCQYSGKKLKRELSSVDHIIPRSRGGKDEYRNLVLSDKKINFQKGNKTPEEAGLKLIRQPKDPVPIPLSSTVREAKDISWKPFLVNNDN